MAERKKTAANLIAKARDARRIQKSDRPDVIAPTGNLKVIARKQMEELEKLRIVEVVASSFSLEEMKKIGAAVTVDRGDIQGDRTVNDVRFGPVKPYEQCLYCYKTDCPGHYGFINFGPHIIYNPICIRDVIRVLSCVCNSCGSLYAEEEDLRNAGILSLAGMARLRAVEEYSKEMTCLRGQTVLPGEKKIMPCQTRRSFWTSNVRDDGEIHYVEMKKEAGKVKKVKSTPLDIKKVKEILDSISDKSAALLGFSKGSHPRNMILGGLLVPPLVARPPVSDGTKIRHDKTTPVYADIVKKVISLKTDRNAVGGRRSRDEETLYGKVFHLFFGKDAGRNSSEEYLSISARFHGKKGIGRNLLLGKRNDQSGRSVIGPTCALPFDYIGLPSIVSKVFTRPLNVTTHNYTMMQAFLRDGAIKEIVQTNDGLIRVVTENNRKELNIRVGDRVNLFHRDGDYIVINRQPTLHRGSLMAFRSYITKPTRTNKGYTTLFHLSHTTPYNADFDGDESNQWNPQSLLAIAECRYIMTCTENICSGENNKPSMGMVMNSVTALYLLSRRETYVGEEFMRKAVALYEGVDVNMKELNGRLGKYGIKPYTGIALIASLLPRDFYYKQKDVVILEGVLVSGLLTKANVGTSHRSIIQELVLEYGNKVATDFFTNAPRVCNMWLLEKHPFTVGLGDLLLKEANEVIQRSIAERKLHLDAIGGPRDDPQEEELREREISGILNLAQNVGNELSNKVLTKDNSINIMTDRGAGTKGNSSNIGQIVGSVGQQFYRGRRLQPAPGRSRILPTFEDNDPNPEARGFIVHSFTAGLTPTETFFMMQAGREGLMDTSLKTSETGTLQRRMTRIMGNMVIAYDGSVRNVDGVIFCFTYNGGYDIGRCMNVKGGTFFIDIEDTIRALNAEEGWIPEDEVKYISDQTSLPPLKSVKREVVSYETLPITRYEKARLIGVRAEQINNNDTILVDGVEGVYDPLDIAEKEYYEGVIPLEVVRVYPNGDIKKVRPTKNNILL